MPEEVFEKLRTVRYLPGVSAHLPRDLLDVVRSKVGQTSELEMVPDLLLRIQIRSVRGQPFDLPVAMAFEIVAHLGMFVGVPSVPQQQQGAPIVSAQVTEKVQHLRPADVLLGVQGQKERDATPLGGHGQRPDARDLLVGTLADRQDRRHPTKSPGSPQERRQQKARLIQANQAPLPPGEFFLALAHC